LFGIVCGDICGDVCLRDFVEGVVAEGGLDVEEL